MASLVGHGKDSGVLFFYLKCNGKLLKYFKQ